MRKSVIQNWVSLVARISALLGLISCAADEGQQLSDLELTEQQLEGPSITEQPVTSQTVTQSGLPVQIKGNSGSVIQDAVLMASGNSFMEGTTIEIAEADNLQEGDQEILKSLLPSQDDSQYDLSPAGPAVQVFVYPAQELQEPLEIHLPLSKSSSSSFGLVATTSQTSYLIYYKPIDNSVRLLNDVDVTVMQDKVSIKTKHLGVFQVWSLKSKAKVRSSEAVEKEIVTIIEEIKEIPTSTAEEEQSKDKEEAVVIIDELQEKVYDEEPDEELELLKKFAESLEEDKETANKLIDIEVNQEPTAPAELAPEEKTNTDFIKVAKNEDGTKSTIWESENWQRMAIPAVIPVNTDSEIGLKAVLKFDTLECYYQTVGESVLEFQACSKGHIVAGKYTNTSTVSLIVENDLDEESSYEVELNVHEQLVSTIKRRKLESNVAQKVTNISNKIATLEEKIEATKLKYAERIKTTTINTQNSIAKLQAKIAISIQNANEKINYFKEALSVETRESRIEKLNAKIEKLENRIITLGEKEAVSIEAEYAKLDARISKLIANEAKAVDSLNAKIEKYKIQIGEQKAKLAISGE